VVQVVGDGHRQVYNLFIWRLASEFGRPVEKVGIKENRGMPESTKPSAEKKTGQKESKWADEKKRSYRKDRASGPPP